MAAIRAFRNPISIYQEPLLVLELAQDFRDLLIELADADADFVMIGGYAVAFHGHPRATKDLDVLVRATPPNAQKVYRALAAFGAPLERFQVTAEDFSDYDGVLQIGLPPRRIDIINTASGITFEEAISDGKAFELEGRRVPVIGIQALITNKLAAGREQDLADVKALNKKYSSRGLLQEMGTSTDPEDDRF